MTRPDSESWLRGKAAGDVAELAIAEWFRQNGYRVFQAVGKTSPDLLIFTDVEVKHDLQAARTGNVAIEVAYSDQPSGLRTTTAVWWAVVAGDEAFICRVSDLGAWLDRADYPTRPSGDGKRALCVLVPLGEFREQAFVRTLNVGGVTDAA